MAEAEVQERGKRSAGSLETETQNWQIVTSTVTRCMSTVFYWPKQVISPSQRKNKQRMKGPEMLTGQIEWIWGGTNCSHQCNQFTTLSYHF